MCDPIIVDIYTTCHLGHRGRVRGSRENDPGNLFASSFLRKYKNPLTHSRSYKYDAGQKIRNGNPESSDVSTGEIPNILVGERGTDPGRDGGRGILQCQPPTDARVRKA